MGGRIHRNPHFSEAWSNGLAEGQINRLKTLKRTMYGRAAVDLLRAQMMPL
jgi:transposase